MRQQYHSRQTDQGRYIWDVHNLIKQAQALTPKDVPLYTIAELNENYWFDGHWPIPTSRNIAEHARKIYESDLQYPVILGPDGRIMDGMHRVCKAFLLNYDTIRVVQFDVEPAPDFIDADIGKLPHDDVPVVF